MFIAVAKKNDGGPGHCLTGNNQFRFRSRRVISRLIQGQLNAGHGRNITGVFRALVFRIGRDDDLVPGFLQGRQKLNGEEIASGGQNADQQTNGDRNNFFFVHENKKILGPAALECKPLNKFDILRYLVKQPTPVKIGKLMEISHLGLTSFKLKGKKATVVVNPFDPQTTKVKFPKVDAADVIIFSDTNNSPEFFDQWRKIGYVIYGPGEYEIGGVDVTGADTRSEGAGKSRSAYRIVLDGVSVVYFGSEIKKMTEEERDRIGTTNVLILPLADDFNSEDASSLIAQLEPAYVVPVDGSQSLQKFLKEMGAEGAAPQPKLVVSADKLPETTTVVVLE